MESIEGSSLFAEDSIGMVMVGGKKMICVYTLERWKGW